ncbi:MAG: LysR family transcriptional regulator [Silvanigrellales bacterium]|nr:LysR family transcriptional regulator [Silvanigrellales bacterium]
MHKGLEDLSVRDLVWLAELPRFTSLSNLARSRHTTPANVSKAFARMEMVMECKLLARSSAGTLLTEEGLELARAATQALGLLDRAAGAKVEGTRGYEKSLRLGSRGFLNVIVAPLLVKRFEASFPELGLTFIDLSPAEKLEASRSDGIDALISVGELDLGKQWVNESVGRMRWGLYGSASHPLTRGQKTLSVDELLPWRILRAAWWDGRAISGGDDFLPLAPHRKSQGHLVQTASTALAICADSRYLVYVPCAAARAHVLSGLVTELRCPELPPLHQTICLSVNAERVDQRVKRQISLVLRALLLESERDDEDEGAHADA